MTKLVDLTKPLEPVDEATFPELLKPLLRVIAPEIEFIDNKKNELSAIDMCTHNCKYCDKIIYGADFIFKLIDD